MKKHFSNCFIRKQTRWQRVSNRYGDNRSRNEMNLELNPIRPWWPWQSTTQNNPRYLLAVAGRCRSRNTSLIWRLDRRLYCRPRRECTLTHLLKWYRTYDLYADTSNEFYLMQSSPLHHRFCLWSDACQ